MKRTTKKIIYGVFYMLILTSLIFWLGGGLFKKSSPSKTFNVLPLKIITPPQIFPFNNNQSIILAKIFNPNSAYAFPDFSYFFKLYDGEGRFMGEKSSQDFIYASETKYIFSLVDLPPSKIKKVDVDFSQLQGVKADKFFKPSLKIINVTTNSSKEGVVVEGVIVNESSLELKEIKLLMIFFDRFGEVVTAYQKSISGLITEKRRPFSVLIPLSSSWQEKIDFTKTEIIINAR